MKRAPLYSGRDRAKPAAPAPEPKAAAAVAAAASSAGGSRLRRFARKHQSPLLFAAGIAIALLAMLAYQSNQAPPREMTQDDVDAAVMHTFETKTLPSRAAKAAELVREAVVRVTGYVDEPPEDEKKEPDPSAPKDGKDATKNGPKDGKGAEAKDRKRDGDAKRAEAGKGAKAGKGDDGGSPVKGPGATKEGKPDSKHANRDSTDKNAKDGKDAKDQKDPPSQANNAPHPPVIPDMSKPGEKKGRIGTGVVIVENGIILSSLHVVAGTKRITVTFSDGMESEADIIGVQPENDLAVLRAKKVPDDQPAATLGSSLKLKPGDEVVAVGFPFGIGPSVSAGVVSGINREFKSPEGGRSLSKLIQFDAAVNPGNSGGPLVTMDGEVVGIVAALLNPTEHRTFIGIGFAVTIESAGSAVGIPPF
jgi:S1-C subfamily serine protease